MNIKKDIIILFKHLSLYDSGYFHFDYNKLYANVCDFPVENTKHSYATA